jgi:hypothetical protein
MNTPAAYFEQLYSDSSDPWSLSEQWYVQRKYDHTLAALPQRRYRSAFEPGCSVGVLTTALAERCDSLLATAWPPRPNSPPPVPGTCRT